HHSIHREQWGFLLNFLKKNILLYERKKTKNIITKNKNPTNIKKPWPGLLYYYKYYIKKKAAPKYKIV
ncbi:hypothetical protein ACVGXX_00325, partial [Enterobacter intestinihominis]